MRVTMALLTKSGGQAGGDAGRFGAFLIDRLIGRLL